MTELQERDARKQAQALWKRRLTANDLVWVQTYMENGYSMKDAVDTLFYDSRHTTTSDPKWNQ